MIIQQKRVQHPASLLTICLECDVQFGSFQLPHTGRFGCNPSGGSRSCGRFHAYLDPLDSTPASNSPVLWRVHAPGLLRLPGSDRVAAGAPRAHRVVGELRRGVRVRLVAQLAPVQGGRWQRRPLRVEHPAADGHRLGAGPVRGLPLVHQPMGVLAMRSSRKAKELLGAKELHRGLGAMQETAARHRPRCLRLARSSSPPWCEMPCARPMTSKAMLGPQTRPGVQRWSRAPPQVECLEKQRLQAILCYFQVYTASFTHFLSLPRPSTTRQSLASSSWIDSCHYPIPSHPKREVLELLRRS